MKKNMKEDLVTISIKINKAGRIIPSYSRYDMPVSLRRMRALEEGFENIDAQLEDLKKTEKKLIITIDAATGEQSVSVELLPTKAKRIAKGNMSIRNAFIKTGRYLSEATRRVKENGIVGVPVTTIK